MATSDLPRDIFTWQRQIESRVAQVEKRDPFINTAFSVPTAGTTQVDGNLTVAGLGRLALSSGGSIELDDKAGRQVFYAGGLVQNGFAVVLTRLNGQAALVFADDDPVNETTQRMRLFDSNGAAMFSEDKSGAGAAWPLAPIGFAGLSWPTWDNNNTSTFATVSSALTYKASPRFVINVQHICDSGTTGEVRLMVNGGQVGTTATVAALSIGNAAFGTPAALPGAVGDAMTLNVDTRVTSGTGKCYARVTYALQWPSA